MHRAGWKTGVVVVVSMGQTELVDEVTLKCWAKKAFP